MKKIIEELNGLLETFTVKMKTIPEGEFSAKPLAHKWSKKEVMGHLVDSAQNNLRRFICAQYEKTPSKITYDQDFWVLANGYQEMEKEAVINLWRLVNQRITAVLKNMKPENYSRSSDTGKESIQLHSLEWLAEDYVSHMKHHLNQVLPGSFDIIY
jgi:hypothetical protein